MGSTYDGIPLADLPIDAVQWTDAVAEHIRTRSLRYGRPEFDVEPEWATEAALDRRRLVRPGRSKSGESIVVLGLSPSAPGLTPAAVGRVLKVWLVPVTHPPAGGWWGASACDADLRTRRIYWETPR